jgi:hypothetical protein
MTIEIRVSPGQDFAGEVVTGNAVLRFAGWLGLMRALSAVIGAARTASTPGAWQP